MTKAMVQKTDVWGYLSKTRWLISSQSWNQNHLRHFPKFGVEQVSIKFISERKLISSLGFMGRSKVFVTTTPLCPVNIKTAIGNIQMNVPDCVPIKLYLQNQKTGQNWHSSHHLPNPCLKECWNLGFKGLYKPCYSNLGELKSSKGSNLPKAKSQGDVSLCLLLVASPSFFDRPVKWMIKQMEPEPVSKLGSQASFVFEGSTLKARSREPQLHNQFSSRELI